MNQRLFRSTISARATAERGAVMFLLVASVLVVILGAALAVDLSIKSTRGQNLQNAADAAALAGVQAFRATDGDEAAAEAAVAALLAQNGFETGDSTSYSVEFPDDVNETEVKVTVLETKPGTFMSTFTGSDSEVSRSATARFESCSVGCTVDVVIPSPFRSVDAAGTGDGYKPIPVGTELYALNHNSSYGGIVCIDRSTEDWCWSDGASRPAYAGGAYAQRNPEMPHAAVFDTKIYWTASDSFGTNLYCFETVTGTPCSTAFGINNRDRASSSEISNSKDRNRGGGTVLVDDKIFVFTDDWRVHCFVPDTGFGVSRCAGYESNGLPSFLAQDGFPENDPSDGNHGSSIDRVVDENTGRVYWTTHIAEGGAGPADCSQDNLQHPVGLVSIQNVASGLYIRAASGSTISESSDNFDDDTHWIGKYEGDDSYGVPRYSFKSVSNGRVLDSDSGSPRDLETSSGVSSDDRWSLNYQVTTSTLQSYYGTYAQESGTDFVTANGTNGQYSDWVIRHPDCFTGVSTSTPTTLTYSTGTWLQCWNTRANQSCDSFTPSLIHTNGDRFSGRLFFYYSAGNNPFIQGVCSSGYDGSLNPDNFEINCVDNVTGVFNSTLSSNLDALTGSIEGVTDSSPAAWGDPHYNDHSNRLFYPSAHDNSRVLCWDFDYGYCGAVEGWSPSFGRVEDYGFFSEGNCVYGLGHNAIFWAFQSEDIFSECTGSTTRTHIEPCDCSGDWKWGTITFDVDISLFDEFYIQVENSLGEIVYPTPDPSNPDDPGHSLHEDGLTVDLNHLPVSSDPDNDFLEILVSVSAENDPWASGEQTFAIEFARAPRLTD